MTTSQILKSIARKLGLTFRIPSSESQKLEAINSALPKFVDAPPYVTGVTHASDAEDTVVLTYSEAVQELGTGQWILARVLDDGTVETEDATSVTQTGASEITLTFAVAGGTVVFISVTHSNFTPAVLSAVTFAPERVGGNHVVWAGVP